MFFVYHGFVSADNYDASEGPIYKVAKFLSASEVLAFHQEFRESSHDECDNAIFYVIEGKERNLIPVEKITTYKLE